MRKNVLHRLLPQITQCLRSNSCNQDCSSDKKILTDKLMNNRFKAVRYGIFGPVFQRTVEYVKMKKEGKKLPFEELYFCNMGDSKIVGNKPITFYRQVVAAVAYPPLLGTKLPSDVKCRARSILKAMKGNDSGSYTHPNGLDFIRENVAEMVSVRDNKKCRPEDVYLCNGGTHAIEAMISIFANEEQDKPNGICYPVPMYPAYTAFIDAFGIYGVSYNLKEEDIWAIDLDRLNESMCKAKKHCYPRALVAINPGNPTGQVLKDENIEEIIKFAHEEKLVIFADEVYNRNVWDPNAEFHAFREVAGRMGPPYDKVEMLTIMSSSKGWCGECGIRAAVLIMDNFDPEVQQVVNNELAPQMCANTLGQTLVEVDMNPPKEGDPSYELYEFERDKYQCDMAKKAQMVTETFSKMEGYTLNPIQGAMFAFPKIQLPPKLIEEANKKKIHPDEHYCLLILDRSGVCLTPGSSFGQDEGTFHIRITVLPPMEKYVKVMELMQKAHQDILKKYS